MKVYGSKRSYYTGKLETYLRYRQIGYERLPTVGHERELIAGAGAVQMPVVRLDDGRWMTDSTPALAWFEEQQEAPSIYPSDPALCFAALLIEDYADEWLWRSAMHYRWSYVQDRWFVAGSLADELLGQIPLPRFAKQMLLIRRQLFGFVRGDGVTRATRDHVERGYLRALDILEQIFAARPFVLGDAPTIADFGLMAPMLRHFSQDPTPAEIMRSRAPGVYEWVARMWNTRASSREPRLVDAVDPLLAELLREACETHLVQLRENARAYASGKTRHDQEIQAQHYRRVPTSRYRVWCLEELRRHWAALDESACAALRPQLPEPGASVLWGDAPARPSDYDPERCAPFNRAINVFARGVPR